MKNSRRKTTERNKEIYRMYTEGENLEKIAEQFQLTKGFVKSVISEQRYRNKATKEEVALSSAFCIRDAIRRFRYIKIGDIVRIKHEVFDAEALKAEGVLTGTVIYKDNKIITVQGDHYAESFQLFDLCSLFLEHIPV